MTDTQLRFLRAIAERLPVDRVAELYVFPPMRQGTLETGIAVVAAVREVSPGLTALLAAAPDVAADATTPDEANEVSADAIGAAADGDVPAGAPATTATPRERHTVYTARYRLALKGPERGRWELNVVEEADAPLLTVEMVVRGVQQRSGEGAEPERLEPHALRELLGVPAT